MLPLIARVNRLNVLTGPLPTILLFLKNRINCAFPLLLLSSDVRLETGTLSNSEDHIDKRYLEDILAYLNLFFEKEYSSFLNE